MKRIKLSLADIVFNISPLPASQERLLHGVGYNISSAITTFRTIAILLFSLLLKESTSNLSWKPVLQPKLKAATYRKEAKTHHHCPNILCLFKDVLSTAYIVQRQMTGRNE